MRIFKKVANAFVLVFAVLGLLAVLSVRSIPVDPGRAQASISNGDVDCDGALTITDPIRLLNYLFLDGPPPCAIAQDDPACCEAMTQILERLTTPDGTHLRTIAVPCGEIDRYVDNGDGTLTDQCTGLMWQADFLRADLDLDGQAEQTFNFNQAKNLAETSDVAGHADWRLPTVGEAESILRFIVEKPFWFDRLPGFRFFFSGQDATYWTSGEWGEPEQPHRFAVRLDRGQPGLIPYGLQERFRVLLVREAEGGPAE